MIGAVLLIVILVDWFIDNRRKKSILFTIILGLSIAFQMQTTHGYATIGKPNGTITGKSPGEFQQ